MSRRINSVGHERDVALYAVLVAKGPLAPLDLMRVARDPRAHVGAWTIAGRWRAMGLVEKVAGTAAIRATRSAFPSQEEVKRLFYAAGLSKKTRPAKVVETDFVPSGKPVTRAALAPWLRDVLA